MGGGGGGGGARHPKHPPPLPLNIFFVRAALLELNVNAIISKSMQRKVSDIAERERDRETERAELNICSRFSYRQTEGGQPMSRGGSENIERKNFKLTPV